jgi:teichuronic acid exporter
MKNKLPSSKELSLSERFKASIISYGFRQFAVMALTLGYNIMLTRYLMPEEFGRVAVITIVMNVAVLLADGGFGVYLIQRHEEITEFDIGRIVKIQMYTSLSLMSLCFIGSASASLISSGQTLGWMMACATLSLPLISVRGMALVRLERAVKIDKVVRVEILEESVYAVTAVYFAAYGAGAWSIVIAQLAKTLTGCAAAVLLGRFRLKMISINWDKELSRGFRFGFHYQATQLINMARVSIIPLYIIPVYGFQAGGFVERALFFCSAPLSIILAVQKKTMFPYISRIQFDVNKIRSFLEESIYASSILDKFMFLPLLIFAREIIQKVFGDHWLPMLPLIYWILVGNVIFGALVGSLYSVANGIGKSEYLSQFNFVSFVVSWILTVPLTYLFGIQGVGIAALIMWISIEWLRRNIGREVGKFIYYRQILKPLVAFFVTWGIISIIISFIPGIKQSVAGLFIWSVLSWVLYAVLLYLVDGKRLKALVKRIRHTEQADVIYP